MLLADRRPVSPKQQWAASRMLEALNDFHPDISTFNADIPSRESEDSQGETMFLDDALLKNNLHRATAPLFSGESGNGLDLLFEDSPRPVFGEVLRALWDADGSLNHATLEPIVDKDNGNSAGRTILQRMLSQSSVRLPEDGPSAMDREAASSLGSLPGKFREPGTFHCESFGRSMDWSEYTEARTELLQDIGAYDDLNRFLRTSFSGIPEIPVRCGNDKGEGAGLFGPAAFHTFASAVLLQWLSCLTEIGFLPETSEDWNRLQTLARGIPFPESWAESGEDPAGEALETLMFGVYDALSETFSDWNGWSTFDALWNVSDVDPEIFTCGALAEHYGFMSCSMTRRMIPAHKTSDQQVLYVRIPKEVGVTTEGEEEEIPEGIFIVYLDGYSEQEQWTIFKYLQAVYDLGNMDSGCMTRFHGAFMETYFPNGLTEEDDEAARIAAVDKAVASCWGMTANSEVPEDVIKGTKILFDVFSQYVMCAWLIDHMMSAHNPVIDNNQWHYNSFSVASIGPSSGDSGSSEQEMNTIDGLFDSDDSDDVEIVHTGAPSIETNFVPPPSLETSEESISDVPATKGRKRKGMDESSRNGFPNTLNDVFILAQLLVNIRKDVRATRKLLPDRPSFLSGIVEDIDSTSIKIDPTLHRTIQELERLYAAIYNNSE